MALPLVEGFAGVSGGLRRGQALCAVFDLDGTATSVRRATWTVYDDANHQLRTAQGYAAGGNGTRSR